MPTRKGRRIASLRSPASALGWSARVASGSNHMESRLLVVAHARLPCQNAGMASQGRWADRIELIGGFGGAIAAALMVPLAANVSSLTAVFFVTLSVAFLSGRIHGWLGRRIGRLLDGVADSHDDE